MKHNMKQLKLADPTQPLMGNKKKKEKKLNKTLRGSWCPGLQQKKKNSLRWGVERDSFVRKQSEAKCELYCELLVRSFEVLSSSESCKGQQHGRRMNSQRVVEHATD
jgi:hypothetical protein